MARTSCLTPIIVVGAVAAFAVPAYGQYANIYVQQDTSTYNVSGGFDANSGDGGVQNTAFGFFALENNGCCGYYNSAFGYSALQNNSLGGYNTAIGYSALWSAGNGSQNTAAGANAMFWTTGSNNSAVGYNAMEQNSSGSYNTAVGYQSLGGNISASTHQTGNNNTAVGANALYSNETGADNTASGLQALLRNTTGANNTASGVNALLHNTTGNENSASGRAALQSNTTGSNNIAEGYKAGYNLTTGSNNIDIGSTGVAAESDTIRIGSATQKATFITGIFGTAVTGSAVVVNSNGKLGVTVSSERYKTAIEPMGANSDKLQQLRPVTFHLKTDPKGALQYGLIAEEVAKVYPELVIRDQAGRIDGVRYDELAPMLLNEMQLQQQINTAQAAEIRNLKQQAAEMRDLKQQVAELKDFYQETQVALRKLRATDEFVAQR